MLDSITELRTHLVTTLHYLSFVSLLSCKTKRWFLIHMDFLNPK